MNSKRYTSFAFWYLALTCVYWVAVLLGFGWSPSHLIDGPTGTGASGNVFVNFLGLFVPLGPHTIEWFLFVPFLALLDVFHRTDIGELMRVCFSVVAGVIAFGALFVGDSVLYRRAQSASPFVRIACNLLVLLVLTALVDFATMGQWQSLYILLGRA